MSDELGEAPLVITLPWKVLVADNARHEVLRKGGGGRRIGLTETYRRSLGAASLLASHQWGQRGTLREMVHVTVVLYEPDKRRRDIANYLKLLLDCLTRVVYVDDSQVNLLTVRRGGISRPYPRAELTITPL